MKQGFYFFFYKRIHNEFLCVILATIAYFLYCVKYTLKKFSVSGKSQLPTVDEAEKIINEAYPEPTADPDYSQQPVDESVDLSVIIPVYNYKKVFEKTSETYVNQKTKYNYEVIFVDDGSTDGVDEILRKHEKLPHVKVIFQKNMGIGGARNTGLCNAKGKYVMFVDCDDDLHTDIVEKLMDKAIENNSDIVMGSHSLVKEKNGVVYDETPNIYPEYNLMRYKNGENEYIMNFPGLPWGKVYRRELFDGVRFFPGLWYEDTIIHGLVFRKAKSFSYLKDVLYDYKWYENNFSHTQGKSSNIKVLDAYWIVKKIIEHSDKTGLENDGVFYNFLLRQLGQFGYGSMGQLDEKVIKAVFVLCCEIINNNRPEKYRLPYMKKQVEKAFISKNFELWKLSSQYQ